MNTGRPASTSSGSSSESSWSTMRRDGDTPIDRSGLDAEQVRDRVATGRVNTTSSRPSRSLSQILRANLLTRFNAILGVLLIVVAFVGPPQDGLFGVVLALNAIIGITQELRTKRALDRLAVLSAPVAHIMRSGTLGDYPTGDVVEDDLLELRPGDQAVVDSVVLEANGLQLDESLLSGEATPVDKSNGDEVLSGSIVASGSGWARASRVGNEAFAQRLQLEAKRFASSYSELQQGTNQMLRVISFALIPMGVLLATSQLLRSHVSASEALRGTVAGVGAMVPEGLVLLTTIAFALGALRLARRKVLVQSLPAIEGLARVDVVCIDKTGTLTMPGITLDHVVELDGGTTEPLGALSAWDPTPNATMQAIAAAYPAVQNWVPVNAVPFSPDRKWSAIQFDGRGTWVLGAPDVLFAKQPDQQLEDALAAEGVSAGKRVLVLARSASAIEGSNLPGLLRASGIVVLSEQLRPDAAETVQYLLSQGIAIKVISGDDPRTVASVAARVGIPLVGEPCDARQLPDDQSALAELVGCTSVFGRVRPGQKRDIVEALQSQGHVVAMTGDGVNDVSALKRADVGIAMGSGSQASRSVANIVLLDSEFATVPPILAEGRRVIANIERVANLFVTKSVYAAALALVVGILALPYPFYPRQLTVISSLTIGIPGFFLALARGAPRAQPHFIGRILGFALPAGLGAAAATLATYIVTRGPLHAPASMAKTAAAASLFIITIVVLALLARPLLPWRLLLVLLMGGGGVLTAVVPLSRRLFAFSIPPTRLLIAVLVVALPVAGLLVALLTHPSTIIRARK
jgi:cation-transporting ATPase E